MVLVESCISFISKLMCVILDLWRLDFCGITLNQNKKEKSFPFVDLFFVLLYKSF